jgi:hypothetical protein
MKKLIRPQVPPAKACHFSICHISCYPNGWNRQVVLVLTRIWQKTLSIHGLFKKLPLSQFRERSKYIKKRRTKADHPPDNSWY